MTMRRWRGSGILPGVAALACLGLAAQGLAPAVAAGQERGGSIQQSWDRVGNLRVEGEFRQAIDILHEIIAEYDGSDEVLRHAYNQLAFTLLIMHDEEGLDAAAREALERFPHLEADPVSYTDQLNTLYDQLRRQMFGSLSVTVPERGRVFLDGDYVGEIPLEIDLLRTGSYELTVTKPGYNEHRSEIEIGPSVRLHREIALDRQRGRGWWLKRIGLGVAAGTALAFALSGGDEAAGPEALPGPPPPPGP